MPVRSSTHPTWLTIFIPLMILWLALGLRLTAAHGRNLWIDEAVEFNVANRPLTQVMAADQSTTHDPPLFSLALNLWMQVGQIDLWLQFLSIVFSVAAVAALMWLGKHLFTATAGWLAGLFAAVAPRSVFFGQEVNQYGLVLLLSVLSLAAIERYLHTPTRRRLLLVLLISVMSLITHYELAIYSAAVLLVASGRIWLSRRQHTPRQLIEWVLMLAAVGASGLLLLIGYALPQKARLPETFAPAYFTQSPSLNHVLTRGLTESAAILDFVFWGTEQPAPAAISLALLAIGSAAVLLRRRGRSTIAYLIAGLAGGYVASGIGFLVYGGRYVWYVFPAAALLAAVAFTLSPRPAWQRAWSFGGLVLGIGLAGWLTTRLPAISHIPFVETEQLGEVIVYVERHRQPDDLAYAYYGARQQFTRYASIDLKQISTIETWARGKPVEERTANLWQVAERQRIWLMLSHVTANEGRDLIEYLTARCQRLDQIEAIGAAGYLFDCRSP